jgi:hypothetical protein
MQIGDVVIPIGDTALRGSGEIYRCDPYAIVASLEPFVLVSNLGDMLWKGVDRQGVRALCQAAPDIVKRAITRYLHDASKPEFQSAESGGEWPKTDDTKRELQALLSGAVVATFMIEVAMEIDQARKQFPGDRLTTIAMVEEVGELCKAVLDQPAHAVREEAIQVAAMAARLAIEGDSSVAGKRVERGLDLWGLSKLLDAIPAHR